MIFIEPLYNLINPETGRWLVALIIVFLIFWEARYWVAAFLKFMYEIFIEESPMNT